MNFRKFAVSTVLFLLMMGTGTASAASLLVNGGFESGDTDGWTLVSGSTRVATVDNNQYPIEGSYLLRIYGGTLTQSGTDGLSAGDTFTLSGYIHGDGGDYGVASIIFYDSVNTVLDSVSTDDISNVNWTAFSISLDVPSSTVSWQVELVATYGHGNYTDVYFDGLTLTASAVPVPGSLSILGLGLAVFAGLKRRQALN